jgi:hypothetical protein
MSDELVEQDFVVDVGGVKRPKRSLRCFDGRFSKWTEEQNERRHGIIRAARFNRSELEKPLAEALGRDMHSTDWLEDTKELYSRGHLIVQRKVWDGVIAEFVELSDAEKRMRLSANGNSFAVMSFHQAMQVANERLVNG